ncbi:hypothetical protein ACN20G_35835 (plasmid) [Streptomyces sp. BI20]|uniref:hypothetical protein n=1 Tax=Streptomyces sp. BI20 TaxID=3403460 RepID=UPI003C71A51D
MSALFEETARPPAEGPVRACPARLVRVPQAVVATVPVGIEYERSAACELGAGHLGAHADLFYEVSGYAAVWVRWHLGDTPGTDLPVVYCPAVEPGGGECCGLFLDHAGAHSWAVEWLRGE